MSFSNDAELRDLFRQEVDERVARLVDGATQLAEGEVAEEVAGTMFREGHTIKGTGRVMGFVAISRAGQALEQVWRDLQHGDRAGSAALATALEQLSRAIPGAVDADPEEGSPDLKSALDVLNEVLSGSAEPEQPEAAEESPAAVAQAAEASGDTENLELGGLLGALDTWASEDMTRVNAAQMYRLINTVASLDLHTQALRSMLVEVADAVEAAGNPEAVQRIAGGVGALEESVRRAREYALHLAEAQIRDITDTFPQLVSYLAKKTGKDIRFELVGDDSAVDRQIIERLGDPLRQLIVNAIEHGVEFPAERAQSGKPSTATLAIRAAIKDHRLELVVEDDGRGIDWDAVHRIAARRGLLPTDTAFDESAARALLFAPGFSTADQESELVGDGNGLTSVAERVEELHGSLDLETELGRGTKITVAVPTSRAMQDAVIVRSGDQQWGIPEAAVTDIIDLASAEIIDDGRGIVWMDQHIPLYDFGATVGVRSEGDVKQAVVLRNPLGATAFSVGEIVGQRQVAAKELGPLLGGTPHLTGAALLGGGDVVVLVDPSRLQDLARAYDDDEAPALRVLVVDDSQGARQVLAGALASSGFDARVAPGTAEALASLQLNPVDAMVVDYSMPGPDGIDLVTAVRMDHRNLPIVMLSGVASPEDQDRARVAGVDAYFDKADFREGALAETLRDLIERREQG